MRMLMSVIVVASALVHAGAAPVDYGPVVHWSADDLKAGRASQLPLQTPTHRFTLVRRTNGQSAQAESMPAPPTSSSSSPAEDGSPLAERSISRRCWRACPARSAVRQSLAAASTRLDPGALISLPPSTAYKLEPDASGLTLVRLTINVGMHPWSIVQTQQTTLATANPNRPPVTIPTNLGQGEVQHWPADLLQRAHQVLADAAASGKPTNDPRDLVNIPMARTMRGTSFTAGSAPMASRRQSSSTKALMTFTSSWPAQGRS